jgi:hypothetical protein
MFRDGGRDYRCVLPKSSVLLCVYCEKEVLNAKDINKKCFLFTVGSTCRVKSFTARWQMFLWWVWNGGVEVLETTVKRLLCCRFRRTVKAVGQVYQCWWRICREKNVFSRFEYHTFCVLYPFVTCLLTLPRIFHGISKMRQDQITSWSKIHMLLLYYTSHIQIKILSLLIEQK